MTSLAADHAPSDRAGSERAIALWLLGVCAMIFAMAVIGAITRLTESGLSIMEWAPIAGALPPLSAEEWERVFAIYRRIPEYQQENAGMTRIRRMPARSSHARNSGEKTFRSQLTS